MISHCPSEIGTCIDAWFAAIKIKKHANKFSTQIIYMCFSCSCSERLFIAVKKLTANFPMKLFTSSFLVSKKLLKFEIALFSKHCIETYVYYDFQIQDELWSPKWCNGKARYQNARVVKNDNNGTLVNGHFKLWICGHGKFKYKNGSTLC